MKSTPLYAKMAYVEAELSKPAGSREIIFLSSARQMLYENCKWETSTVRLSRLTIDWPTGMGHRKWARGSLPLIAAKFRRRRRDAIWRLVKAMPITAAPIIVIRGRTKLSIDDGCHRAVALYLAGHKTAHALIGTPRHSRFFEFYK